MLILPPNIFLLQTTPSKHNKKGVDLATP